MIAETTAAEFFEARVLEATANGLRVEPIDGGASRTVSPDDLYALDAPRTASGAGQFGICNVGEGRWVACRIEAGEEQLSVVTPGGDEHQIPQHDVLRPTALTRLNIEKAFERASDRRAFVTAARKAGSPHPYAGWRPSGRERVVAREPSGWFSAKIREIEDDGIYVEWQSGDRTTKVSRASVVPEPPYPKAPSRGHFALLRPDAAAHAWVPVRIERVESNEAFSISDASGAKKQVQRRDLLPLTRN